MSIEHRENIKLIYKLMINYFSDYYFKWILGLISIYFHVQIE